MFITCFSSSYDVAVFSSLNAKGTIILARAKLYRPISVPCAIFSFFKMQPLSTPDPWISKLYVHRNIAVYFLLQIIREFLRTTFGHFYQGGGEGDTSYVKCGGDRFRETTILMWWYTSFATVSTFQSAVAKSCPACLVLCT